MADVALVDASFFANTPYAAYRVEEIERKLQYYPMDIMLTGATGVGKSSTLNSLLGAESAKVGYGVDPETKHIQKYMLNRYIRLWDTPGLGDNPADDAAYTRAISDLLRKRTTAADGSRGHIIDMALVLVDAGSRDIGTVYSILNTLIFSRINENRVLLAVNQADMAMKRRHWEGAAPDDTLRRFLDEQAESLQKRVFEATGKRIKKPVYYSAANNFNLYSLIDYIIDSFDEFQWELRT